MKHLRALLMAVALSVIVVGPVKGDWDWEVLNATGGNNFATSASVHLWYYDGPMIVGFATFDGAVTMEVTNVGFGESFKAIGLMNLPSGWVVSGYEALIDRDGNGYVDETSNWDTKAKGGGFEGGGLLAETYAYLAPSPSPTWGLQKGQMGKFSFYLRFDATEWDPDMALVEWADLNLGVGIHAGSSTGIRDCSTKLGIMADGVLPAHQAGQAAWDPSCTPTVVPEPSTVILLGTGLVGLFGVAWRRRREDEV